MWSGRASSTVPRSSRPGRLAAKIPRCGHDDEVGLAGRRLLEDGRRRVGRDGVEGPERAARPLGPPPGPLDQGPRLKVVAHPGRGRRPVGDPPEHPEEEQVEARPVRPALAERVVDEARPVVADRQQQPSAGLGGRLVAGRRPRRPRRRGVMRRATPMRRRARVVARPVPVPVPPRPRLAAARAVDHLVDHDAQRQLDADDQDRLDPLREPHQLEREQAGRRQQDDDGDAAQPGHGPPRVALRPGRSGAGRRISVGIASAGVGPDLGPGRGPSTDRPASSSPSDACEVSCRARGRRCPVASSRRRDSPRSDLGPPPSRPRGRFGDRGTGCRPGGHRHDTPGSHAGQGAAGVSAPESRLATSAATASVNVSVDSWPPRSRVRTPCRSRSSVAFLTAWPTATSPSW